MREKEFDIVIIGSGSGGGTAAAELSRLCAGGVRIAVLERGPRPGPGSFTGRELEMVGRLYADSGGFFTKDNSMTLAFCHAYGGSTTVYTGTSLIMKRKTVEKWGVPGLGWEEMDKRSKKFFESNSIHMLDESLINDNNRLFKKGCGALGLKVTQFPVNVKGCRGAGVCNLGCPNGAKQGTDKVQLPLAEKNGVQVITNCRAERLGDREIFAEVAEAPRWAERSPWEPGRYRIRAGIVVLCGGTLGTCPLLLGSNLPVRLPMLGKRITLHPALILVALHETPLTNYQGHPKSYCCEDFCDTGGFILETCFYFPFTTAKSCTGFGAEHEELMRDVRRQQQIIALAWDRPDDSNRITVSRSGGPVLDYRLSDKVIDSLHSAVLWGSRIFFAAGAAKVHAPASKKFLMDAADAGKLDELVPRANMLPGRLSFTSAHIMGGCGMGASPADSVTDSRGRVHGVPWLFVADSSLFPRCSEVNPYVTIMALADRVAEGIAADAGRLLNR